jgi:hypothetical protein
VDLIFPFWSQFLVPLLSTYYPTSTPPSLYIFLATWFTFSRSFNAYLNYILCRYGYGKRGWEFKVRLEYWNGNLIVAMVFAGMGDIPLLLCLYDMYALYDETGEG